MTSPAQIESIIVKFFHATGGLYIWEFFITLDYEWRVIRGHLPYRWTILIYSLARVAALLGVILSFVYMDVTTAVDCQVLVLFSAIFFCLSAIAASLLLVLRTIAIWNRNKAVLTLAITVWGASVGFHLRDVALLRSSWDPTKLACVPVKLNTTVLDFIPAIIADIALFLIILSGMLILRRHGGTFGLTRLLWKQGVIWIALGCVVEVPALVFTMFHLKDSFHYMLETPSLIVMTIAATRMHRSLVNFASGSMNEEHESPQGRNLVFAKNKKRNAASTVVDRIEVAVDKASKQHPAGPMSDDDSSTIIGSNERMSDIVGDLS